MPRLKEWKWGEWAQEMELLHAGSLTHIVAVDTETTGLGYYDEPFAATVTWPGRNGVGLVSGYFELADDRARQSLRQILASTPVWVFHNAKFDLQKLLLAGLIDWDLIHSRDMLHDTQTEYMLLDENGRKGLKELAVRVLGYDDTIHVPYADAKRKKQFPEVYREVAREKYQLDKARRQLGLKKEDGYHLLPRDVLIPYAMRDTEFTMQLHQTLWPQLQAKDEQLQELYQHEMDLQLVVLRMEADGLALDLPYLEAKTSEYGERVMDKWFDLVELVGDEEFNPNAPAQILAAFERRGVRLPDTKAATLERVDDDLARALQNYREDVKIHGTYLTAMLSEQRGGIIHPNFNMNVRTGRMSSSKAKE